MPEATEKLQINFSFSPWLSTAADGTMLCDRRRIGDAIKGAEK
jgi:hypothetical protein